MLKRVLRRHASYVSALQRLRPAVIELALAVCGMVAGGLVYLLITALGVFPSEGPWASAMPFLAGPFITAVAAFAYRWAAKTMDEGASERQPESSPAAQPRARAPIATSLLVGLLGSVVAVGGSFVIGLLLHLIELPVEEQGSILDVAARARDGEGLIEFGVLTVGAVLLAPFAEEWLFRGLLFRRILSCCGRPEAYCFSAAAFAAIHTNPAGFITYLWLGVVFAAAMQRTGRLWVAAMVHMGNNAFALTMLYFAPELTP